MPRTPLVNPKRAWLIRLPETLMARVLSDLWSEVEGCVPYGAQSRFIEACIMEHYQRLDEQRCKESNAPTHESGGAAEGDLNPSVSVNEFFGEELLETDIDISRDIE